jgi:two-component system C4-dicarboxylate transport sensor histidine kinase DctB
MRGRSAAGPIGEPRAGEVRLSARPQGAEVEIRCEDSGPGFSDEALKRAFEPFFTTKEVGRGTGLGLATCLQVIEAAGGRIQVSNREEGGARVRIRLPAAPGAPG